MLLFQPSDMLICRIPGKLSAPDVFEGFYLLYLLLASLQALFLACAYVFNLPEFESINLGFL